jgi:hypothetical protein
MNLIVGVVATSRLKVMAELLEREAIVAAFS